MSFNNENIKLADTTVEYFRSMIEQEIFYIIIADTNSNTVSHAVSMACQAGYRPWRGLKLDKYIYAQAIFFDPEDAKEKTIGDD